MPPLSRLRRDKGVCNFRSRLFFIFQQDNAENSAGRFFRTSGKLYSNLTLVFQSLSRQLILNRNRGTPSILLIGLIRRRRQFADFLVVNKHVKDVSAKARVNNLQSQWFILDDFQVIREPSAIIGSATPRAFAPAKCAGTFELQIVVNFRLLFAGLDKIDCPGLEVQFFLLNSCVFFCFSVHWVSVKTSQ